MKNLKASIFMIFMTIFILLLSACHNDIKNAQSKMEKNPITTKLGDINVDIILKSTETTVYCLNPYETNSEQKYKGFALLGQSKKVNNIDLDLLKVALLEKENYDLTSPSNKCLFTPTIAYNFKNENGKELTALICFRCNEWRITGANNQIFSFNGAPGHDKMVRISDSFCANAAVEVTDSPAIPISLPNKPEEDKPEKPEQQDEPIPVPVVEQPVIAPVVIDPAPVLEPVPAPTSNEVTNYTDRSGNSAILATSEAVKKFFGEEKIKVIQNISKVTLYYLEPFSTDNSLKKLGNYAVIKELELSKDKANELQKIILDEKNYYFDSSQKMCLFTPELGAEIENEQGEKVRALFSFRCNEWKYEMNGKKIIEDTELGYDPLAKFAKTVFADFKL